MKADSADHALKQPDVFLRLRDAPIIRLLYERMAQIQQASDTDVNDVSAYVVSLAQLSDLTAEKLTELQRTGVIGA